MPDDEASGHETHADALDATLPDNESTEKGLRQRKVSLRNQLSSQVNAVDERTADGSSQVGVDQASVNVGHNEDRKGQQPSKSKSAVSEENIKDVSPTFRNSNEDRRNKAAETGTTDQPSSVQGSIARQWETSAGLRKRNPPKASSKQFGGVGPQLSGIEEDEAGESTAESPDIKQQRQSDSEDGVRFDVFPTPGDSFLQGTSRNFARNISPLVNGAASPSKSVSVDEVVHKDSATGRVTAKLFSGKLGGKKPDESSGLGHVSSVQATSSGAEARNRWRRATQAIKFANHISHSTRTTSSDLLEHVVEDNPDDNASRAGAAAFEGAKVKGRFRSKGRRGMEGMIVRQDKSVISAAQDFYVACLKMPISHFLLGVFLAPIALGLLFTPLYLLDRGGLTFDGKALADATMVVSRVAKARRSVSALVNVFFYALSLSTTFGGSPVAALSPYCLCVANVNTLMGQFLFVFLSGAVFARMSQPSQPIRCANKAIIRRDDFTTPTSGTAEKFKVFAIRLVLTGPPPCELVDAKICVTFRIFVKLPSGSMFCSTQDLELVRPEVSYLRYGIMVRHVIDQKSPMYGHTKESLLDGDASFSLTVMGLERASMQPIFHLEDYFMCDGDVAWDADYVDFIHINADGQRVLDHAKIDVIEIKDTKVSPPIVPEEEKKPLTSSQIGLKGWKAGDREKSKALRSKSTSFTRAY